MADTTTNTMLQKAIWYAEMGYQVFPCVPGDKRPLTTHGLLDATTDIDQIEKWWNDHQHANVAIRTEGMVVIDDPDSILKCTNKVYLAELLSNNKVGTPRTVIVPALSSRITDTCCAGRLATRPCSG